MPSSNNDNNKSKGQSAPSEKGVYLDRSAKRKIALATLILLTIILVFAALQPVFFSISYTQKYSELGILGPNLTVGNYPTSILQNQSFTLYGYLVNQKGTAQYYNVLVKIGNQSTQISNSTYSNAPVIAQYYSTLDNNQTYIFPMNLSIGQTGANERLIFELWSYKTSSSGGAGIFVYTGVWDQIWLSVSP
jgi:uncharacterized membrane protein